MRVMVERDYWGASSMIVNADQEQLDNMEEYWGDQYFDLPDELYERYLKALEVMEWVTSQIEALIPPGPEEELSGDVKFEWVEDELIPGTFRGKACGVSMMKRPTPFGDLVTVDHEGDRDE